MGVTPGSHHVHGADADRWGGWHWRTPDRGEHFRRCSYCGSIHPADLVAESNWHAEWSDMKYGWPHKFYVQIPNRDPDTLYCISSTNREHPGEGYIPYKQLTRRQRQAVRRSGMGLRGRKDRDYDRRQAYLFGTHTYHFGKFYTLHLKDPDIPDEVKERIHTVSGLRLTFRDGRVSWQPT